MQIGVTFFVKVLLCFFICTCKGAPPAGETSGYRPKYSEIEDAFIVEELSNILDGRTPVYKREVWQKIEQNHRKKLKANTPGFTKERTSESLRGRFRDVLGRNLPHTKVQVPETLFRKINQGHSHQLNQGRIYKCTYNEKEINFIFDELRKPEITTLFGLSTLEALRDALDRKRRANAEGFENKRSARSISNLLLRYKQKGRLPEDILKKFLLSLEETNAPDMTGASSRSSAAQNQEADVQDADIFEEILKNPICDLDIVE